MRLGKQLTLGNGLASLAVVACIAAAVFSYRAHVIAEGAEETNRKALAALRQDIDRIEGRLVSMAGSRTESGGPASGDAGKAAGTLLEDVSSGVDESGEVSLETSQREELMRLRRIVESTGLEELAESGEVDLTFLRDMSDRRSRMMAMGSARRGLSERNEERHAADAEFYGDELRSLYEKARMRRRGNVDDGEREAAFNELLDAYPDSYAAASLIADRALVASFQQDTESVEEYYDMLISNGNEDSRSVLTSMGTEAMPAIELYLARQYIQEGRSDDAEELLDSLDRDYADSMIFSGRRGARHGRPFQPVSQIVERLRAMSEEGE